MAINAMGNSSLDVLSSAYKPKDKEKSEDILGRDAFLTMLVAQLKNQDPMNPMEGSDFSAQLAQFSQLEQLMNLNTTMESLKTEKEGQSNVVDHVGKTITANVDTLEVVDGTPFGGFYNIEKSSDVMVKIYDKVGNEVRTLYPGQKSPGAYNFKWDARSNSGSAVEDGSYTYAVLASNGSGFVEVPTIITGTVDSVVYNQGKAYLKVQGVLVDPSSVIEVGRGSEPEKTPGSAVDYLGRKVSTSMPLVEYDGTNAEAGRFSFTPPGKSDVILRIFDESGQQIRSIRVDSEDVLRGEKNEVAWDGTDKDGKQVPKGLYAYAITSDSGAIDVSVSDEVTEIRVIDGTQYLVLGNSGFLSAVSTITNVKKI